METTVSNNGLVFIVKRVTDNAGYNASHELDTVSA